MLPFTDEELKIVSATLDIALEKDEHSIRGPKSFSTALRRHNADNAIIQKAERMTVREVQKFVREYELAQYPLDPPEDIEVSARRSETALMLRRAGFDLEVALAASGAAQEAFDEYVRDGLGSAHAVVAAACRAMQRRGGE